MASIIFLKVSAVIQSTIKDPSPSSSEQTFVTGVTALTHMQDHMLYRGVGSSPSFSTKLEPVIGFLELQVVTSSH